MHGAGNRREWEKGSHETVRAQDFDDLSALEVGTDDPGASDPSAQISGEESVVLLKTVREKDGANGKERDGRGGGGGKAWHQGFCERQGDH